MVKKERLLIVTHLMSQSMETYRFITEELALRLAEKGWVVFTTSGKKHRLLRALDMLWTAFRLRHEYDVCHIDVFSGSAFLWAEAVSRLMRILGKPYTLTLHGGNLPAFSRRWPNRVRRLFEPAFAVTAPSNFLIEACRVYRDDLQLIVNPIEVSRFVFVERKQPQPCLIWVRAFNFGYNPLLAVQIITQLVAEFPDIQLIMVGPDKGDGSFQAVQNEIQVRGLAEHIRCVGGVLKEEVPQWLASADIFLNTTNVDNAPVSLVEAMACGLPIVTTNVGGIPYIVEHENTALLVAPEDPDAMAAAVRHILTEPTLAARLSRNARAEAEKYDWSQVLLQWDALLTAAMSGNQ